MIYEFKHPDREEYIEVQQAIDDTHEYFDEDGVKWERVFSSPQVSMGTSKVDPFSQKDYLKVTRDEKGTVGDLLDRSQELSEKRAEQAGGVDPIKQKFLKDYKDKRGGVEHPDAKPKEINKNGISIKF